MAREKEKVNHKEVAERLDRLADFLPSALVRFESSWPTGDKIQPFSRDKFISTTLQALRRQPRLMAHNADAHSLMGALRECIEYGLYPDDLRGYFYLTPRWDKDLSAWKCVAILGYRGFVYLFRRSPMAAEGNSVQSERVYDDDVFEVEKGLVDKLVWRPDLKAAETPDRKLKLVYSILRYKDGTADFDWTMRWQIEQIKNYHSDAASSSFSPWNSKSDLVRSWMEKKTSLKQTLKLSPALDDVMAAAVTVDDLGDIQIDQGLGGRLDKKMRDAISTLFADGNTQVSVGDRTEGAEPGKVEPKGEAAIAGRTLGALMERDKAKAEPEKPAEGKGDPKKPAEGKGEPEAPKAPETEAEALQAHLGGGLVEPDAKGHDSDGTPNPNGDPKPPREGFDADGNPNPPKVEPGTDGPPAEVEKKKRGRPKGAKNKPKPKASVSKPPAPEAPEPEAPMPRCETCGQACAPENLAKHESDCSGGQEPAAREHEGDMGPRDGSNVAPKSTPRVTDPDPEPMDPDAAWDDLENATK